jgi:uncharacterized membrane protein YdjX (TVP38/TMEM64 family)
MGRFLRKHWRLVVFVALLIFGTIAYRTSGLQHELNLKGIDHLRAHALAYGWRGMAVYTAVYIACLAVGMPNLPFQLAAGAIYGIWPAYVMMFIGVNLGALGAFLVARYLGRRSLEQLVGHKLIDLNRAIERKGNRYLLVLRLIPMVPFNAVNFASGLSRMRISVYIAATVIGTIPLTLLHVSVGHAMGRIF